MRQRDLAWAAGLFDGEGCVVVTPAGGNKLALGLRLQMVHKPTIQKFKRLFGLGTLRMEAALNERCRRLWLCTLRGQQAAFVAKLLSTYSVTKREELLILVAMAQDMKGSRCSVTPHSARKRRAAVIRVRDLKRREYV